MKTMNKKKTAYTAITALILLTVNLYIGSHSMYLSKAHKIDENYSTLESISKRKKEGEHLMLVVGNSYVRTSFRPEYNDRSGVNIALFTVHGMPMNDAVSIVENLSLDLNIDSVLIGFGYNYANPVGGDSSAYKKHFSNNPITKLWSSIPLVRGRSMSVVMLSEDIKCVRSLVSGGSCAHRGNKEENESDNVATANETEEDKPASMHASISRRYAEYLPFTQSINDNFKSNLESLKSACDKRSIKLLAYTAPVYSGFREKLDAGVIEEFRNVFYELGIKYIDLNTVFPDWPAESFTDATHVRPVGSGESTTSYLLNNSGWF